MPIKIVHGGYGSQESAQGIRQSAGQLAQIGQNDQRLELQRQQEERYQQELALASRRLDMKQALDTRETGVNRAAGELGAAAKATADAGFGNFNPGQAASDVLKATLGLSGSQLGLQPGKDFEDVFSDRAVALLRDPQMSADTKRQLLKDLETAHEVTVQAADDEELAGMANDLLVRYGPTAGEEWSAQVQEALNDVQNGTFASKREAQKVLRGLRDEAALGEKKNQALELFVPLSSGPEAKLDPDQLESVMTDIRRAKTAADVDGLIADAMVRSVLTKDQYDAHQAMLQSRENVRAAGPDPYPMMGRDKSLSQMSPREEAFIRAHNGMAAPERGKAPTDSAPTVGTRPVASLPPAEAAQIADDIRVLIEQQRQAGADGATIQEKMKAFLTGLDIQATPDDVKELLRQGNDLFKQGKLDAEKAAQNSPEAIKARQRWGGVRN